MKRHEDGQSLVEFALILPIIMLILIGVFDLGRVVWINNTLSDGSRHGARHAAIDPRGGDYCGRVDEAVQSAILDQPLATYRVTYQRVAPTGAVTDFVLCNNGATSGVTLPVSARPGDRVRVDLVADVALATPLVAWATGRDAFQLEAESTMQVTFAP